MNHEQTDRTTIKINIWSVFADAVLAMLLLLIFFIFAQFLANSKALVKLVIEGKQRQMALKIEDVLAENVKYLTIVNDGNLQRLRFSDAILFDEASDRLKLLGKEVLAAVGNALSEGDTLYEEIMIEGHTDDKPIKTRRFPSNWELSSARATAVVRFLEEQTRIDPKRYHVSAVGRSKFVPTNSDYNPYALSAEALEQARAVNRRIEIVLVYSERGIDIW